MVVIRLAKPVSSEYECEDPTLKIDGFQLVRPCERYNELYKDCRYIRSRIHQYYVYGEFLDCNQHESNYRACIDYRNTRDPEKLEPVIGWERNLIQTRMNTVTQNKAWELRETPPAEFNAQLPDFIAKRTEKSGFIKLIRDAQKH